MRVLGRVAGNFLRHQVRIDDMPFGFMPERSTTDAIFIVRQLQEKFNAVSKTLYTAFIDLEKDIRSCTQACHLVGSYQARRWWVAGAAHTEHVRKKQKQSVCWLQPEWRVQCESGHSLRLFFEPLTIHHGSGSPLPWVSYRMSLGTPVCRWPGYHHWIAGGITTEADSLEDQHGRTRTSGQHGQKSRSWYLGRGSMCFNSLQRNSFLSFSGETVEV